MLNKMTCFLGVTLVCTLFWQLLIYIYVYVYKHKKIKMYRYVQTVSVYVLVYIHSQTVCIFSVHTDDNFHNYITRQPSLLQKSSASLSCPSSLYWSEMHPCNSIFLSHDFIILLQRDTESPGWCCASNSKTKAKSLSIKWCKFDLIGKSLAWFWEFVVRISFLQMWGTHGIFSDGNDTYPTIFFRKWRKSYWNTHHSIMIIFSICMSTNTEISKKNLIAIFAIIISQVLVTLISYRCKSVPFLPR